MVGFYRQASHTTTLNISSNVMDYFPKEKNADKCLQFT